MGSITVRPASVYKNQFAWAVTGAGSLDAALRDNSDSSYVTGPTTGSAAIGTELWVQFGIPVGLPSTAQIRSVTLQARYNGANTVGQALAFSLARLSPFKRWNLNPNVINPVGSTIATWTLPTIQDTSVTSPFAISNMVCILTSNHANNKVYEIILNVNYNDRPQVTVTSPTGTITDTSTPQVNWTPFEPDGDSIERSIVRIYSSAVYGLSGFTAEDTNTYQPFIDSGEMFTGDTFFIPTTPLPDTGTFRAYVKLSDAGSGGAYGEWAYSQFQIGTSPLAVPVITVTADSVNARNQIAIQARNNILSPNQSNLETDTSGWVADTNCSIARSTTNPKSGLAALQMTSTASGDMIARAPTTNNVLAVLPNTQYTVMASYRAGTTGRACITGIRWYTSGGSLISTSVSFGITDSSGGYTQDTATVTSPGTAAFAVVIVRVNATAAGEVHRVDEIGLAPGANTSWSRGLGGSVGSSNVNLFPSAEDASFESGTTGSWGLGTEVNCTTANDGTTGADGTKSLKATITSAANQPYFWYNGAIPHIQPGQQYTFLATLKCSGSNRQVTLRMEWCDQFGRVISNSDLTVTATTSFVQYASTAVAPALTDHVNFGIIFGGVSTSDTFNFDKFSLAIGNSTTWVLPGTSTSSAQIFAYAVVEYSDDSGVTWTQVRGAGAIDVNSTAQTATVFDYESPPGMSRTYRARTYTNVPVLQASGNSATGSATVPVGSWWLKDLDTPANNMILPIRAKDLEFKDTEAATPFVVIGRANPVVVSDGLKGDQFSLDAVLNATQMAAFRILRRQANTLLLQSDMTGMQWYVSMQGDGSRTLKITPQRQSSPTWAVSMDFTEVDRPS